MRTALLEEGPAQDDPAGAGGFARFGLHVWPSLGLTACLCRFSLARFDEELFALHGVRSGSSLSRAVTKRRAEFLAGRLCAAQALACVGAAGPVPAAADRSPVWPAGVIGSITHCGDTAMAVALRHGRFRGVGIDLERRAACREASLDVRQFATEAERLVLQQAGIACENHAVIAFSMKESFFKAAYAHVGRYFGFEAVAIVEADASRRMVSLAVAQDLAAQLPQGLRVEGEYAALGDALVATAVVI